MAPNPKYTNSEFGLHPGKKLFITLHKNVNTNPHDMTKALGALPQNDTLHHYAVMDATRIVSLNHINIAANNALMRGLSFGQSKRGIALDTVVCAAGSTNVGSVLKDYAFDKNSKAATDSDSGDTYNVIFLGFDVEEDEYEIVMNEIGLMQPDSEESMISFLERERSNEDVIAMTKIFKTTKEEIDMQGLERAVLHRVASKFHM